MSLVGKKILVTGSSSGIGQSCAILASKLGASVVLSGRDQARLAETESRLEGSGHIVFRSDLTNTDSVEELFTAACSDGIKLNGLIHAAGIGPVVPIGILDYPTIEKVMTINYYTFLLLVKYFSKKKYGGAGSVVGISSVASQAGWQGISLYSGSKGAMDSSSRALAIELAPKGIRVNTVVPSNIKTPMYDAVVAVSDEEASGKILARQPLGIGMPDDVAHAALFLISDAARFITGGSFPVDGGYLAQ